LSSKSKLESAAHLAVQRNGLKSLSFRTLGAEVGVKSSSVHYHFPEKSDLAGTLISRYRVAFAELVTAAAESNISTQETFINVIDAFIAECKDGRMCLAGMLAAENESLSSENRENLNGFFNDCHAWFSNEFDKARDELVVDLPSETLAAILLSGLEGAMLMDRVDSSVRFLDAQKILVNSWLGKIN